jgi:hypothetical protein
MDRLTLLISDAEGTVDNSVKYGLHIDLLI